MKFSFTPTVLDERREILGSQIRITVVLEEKEKDLSDTATEAIKKAFGECQRLDFEYSRFRDNNQLSKLNAELNVWQKVSPELFSLLKKGLEIGQKTDEAFNLGVKKTLEAWGYDKNYSFQVAPNHEAPKLFLPSPYELKKPDHVKLFQPIELGGLGKGYALDLMAVQLDQFKNICIDAGGDLYARGKSETGEPWKMLFEHPLDPTMAIGEVEVEDFYLAASNPLKRRWKNYHHLVDPKAQRPADQMLAVYTQADNGLLADAYSTALFVMGFDRAKELLSSLPIEATLISPRGEVYHSQGFRGKFFQ